MLTTVCTIQKPKETFGFQEHALWKSKAGPEVPVHLTEAALLWLLAALQFPPSPSSTQ